MKEISLAEEQVDKFVELLKQQITRVQRNKDQYAKDYANSGRKLQIELARYSEGIGELKKILKDVEERRGA